jgi:short-subunit dehydrogenase
LDVIEQTVKVNLIAGMLLTRLLLPGMLNRRNGHIVNISSVTGIIGTPFCEPYVATKAALIGFTQSLRTGYRVKGVSASVICPGLVEAGIYQRLREKTGLDAPRIMGTSSPEEVARAVIKAIQRDTPKITVARISTKLLLTIAGLSPSTAEWILQFTGVAGWLEQCAEILKKQSPPTKGSSLSLYT